MIRVQVRPNETLEAALRRFKRQCNYAGIFRLAKKYSYHEKRSDKRRREERERIRNIQRALRKANKQVRPRSMKRGKGRPGGGGGDKQEQTTESTATTTTAQNAPQVESKPTPTTNVVATPPAVQPETTAKAVVAEAGGANSAGQAEA
jgi:small subunit ribosomal protein S21